MNDQMSDNTANVKPYSIDEMENLMMDENRRKAEPILMIMKEWLEKQGNQNVDDICSRPVLLTQRRTKLGMYYMQVLLDHNDITIIAALEFDYRNRIRVEKIVSEINANEEGKHLGYAHAYILGSRDMYISYKYGYDFGDSTRFDPEKHFAKYWNSIVEIVELYYEDITSLPTEYRENSDHNRSHSHIMDKFFATIEDEGYSELGEPYEPGESDES